MASKRGAAAPPARVPGASDEEYIAALGLPLFELRPSTSVKDCLALFPRATMKRGAPGWTGQSLAQPGLALVQRDAEADEGFIEGITLFDEAHTRADAARTRLHRKAVRLLCGPQAVAALESGPIKRIMTSAWLMTGGDVERSAEGVAPFLHTLDPL